MGGPRPAAPFYAFQASPASASGFFDGSFANYVLNGILPLNLATEVLETSEADAAVAPQIVVLIANSDIFTAVKLSKAEHQELFKTLASSLQAH